MNLNAIPRRLRMLSTALLWLWLWLWLPNAASAQELVTEVLPAGFRSAAELAAILKPLIPPPGSVAGFHNQLVIKTTAANLAELRQLLAKLDKAPANLLISVRRNLDDDISHDLAQARLALRSRGGHASIATQRLENGDNNNQLGNGSRATVRHRALKMQGSLQQRTVTNQDESTQRVRVLEGKEAFIRSGESIAVADRQLIITGSGVVVNEATRQEEFGSGFWASARLNGDQVVLEIYPNQRRRHSDGSASVQGTSTSVSAVLGQWMEIGGVNIQAAHSRSAIGSVRRLTTRQRRSTYVKVERLN
jgi:hypothetical protein